jgi:acetyl esterase/lipase
MDSLVILMAEIFFISEPTCISMKVFLFFLLAVLIPAAGNAQSPPLVIPLWEKGAPGFESRRDEPEEARDYWVRSIHNPSLTVFRPPAETANGCAIVVAPGGGYRELVYEAEGRQTAQFLNSLGVTAFVLKYRLPNQEGSPYKITHVQQDAMRAVRMVRSRAAEFGLDPGRVGMLGFSAGGAVAMIAGYDRGLGDSHALDPIDRLNSQPNFLMLVYPGGGLYPGGHLPKRLLADTPPTFLLCANDDEYECDVSTVELLEKYRAAKVPVELHLLARGKHAFNMGNRSTYLSVQHWPQRLADWLADSGYLYLTPTAGK